MKLKTKISLIVMIAWTTVAILFYFGSQRLILSTYLQLENQTITDSLNRTEAALNQSIDTIMVNVKDWSIWDETYQFMQDRNQNGRFINSTLTLISLESLNSDMILLFDTNGKLVTSLGVNQDRDKIIDIPQALIQAIASNRKLINLADIAHSAKGLIATPAGILLVASHSILDSQGKGPSHGTLIIAKYLTKDLLENIKRVVGENLNLYRFPEAAHLPDLSKIYASMIKDKDDTVIKDHDKLTAYRFINDLNGENIAILKAEMPRKIYRVGVDTIAYSNFMLFMYGIILTVFLWLLLQYLIVKRIEKLSRHIGKMSRNERIHSKLIENISDEVSSVAALYHQATHDPLTGLANRNLLHQAFNEYSLHLSDDNKKILIIFIDLDHFKHLNDSFGHDIGDEILIMTAKRITSTLRGNDLAARLGGDEFIAMLVDIEADQIKLITNRLFKSINHPITFGDHEFYLTCSMGVCIYPNDGTTIDLLIKQADMALYNAKENGRNQYEFYSASLNQSINESRQKEIELQYALDDNQLCLYYQPIYDCRTKQIVSMEALIRWNHPTKGLLGADDIIPVAERTSIIYPIGDWILKTVCAQLCAWKKLNLPLVPIAMNISAIQLKQTELGDNIKKILAESDIPANLLEIEITETGFINITPKLINELYALKAAGIKLIIDDFGTGYAGLGYLKSLPVSKLKIDKSFIRDIQSDPDDKAITLAIIAIAHQLNLTVTAEGVENIEQYNFLCYHQADEAQGHFMSEPLSATDCQHLLAGEYVKKKT